MPESKATDPVEAAAQVEPEVLGQTAPKATDPVDALLAQKAALMNAISSGVRSIETPQLGRVEYPNIDQLILALNLVNGQIAALEGGGVSRTQPVIAQRGLWPPCGSSEGGIWK